MDNLLVAPYSIYQFIKPFISLQLLPEAEMSKSSPTRHRVDASSRLKILLSQGIYSWVFQAKLLLLRVSDYKFSLMAEVTSEWEKLKPPGLYLQQI